MAAKKPSSAQPGSRNASTAVLTMTSGECLGEAFRLMDAYRRAGGGAASSTTTTASSSALSTSSNAADLDKGLEMLLAAMEHVGLHLLPSCDAIGRRLSRLFPNRADPTIHSPHFLWRSLRTYCTIFGASSGKILGDCLQQAIERPSSVSSIASSIPGSAAAVTGTSATAAVTLGHGDASTSSAAMVEFSTPVLDYFGGVDAAELGVVADALLCAGPYVNGSSASSVMSSSSALMSTTSSAAATQLMQQFAQRLAQEISQVLTLTLEPAAGSGRSVTTTSTTTLTTWTNIVSLLQALVLSCRPLPAIVLSVAQRVCGSAMYGAPRSATALFVAVHQLRATCKLVTMPEALPWYIPPSDAVAPPQVPPTAAVASHATTTARGAIDSALPAGLFTKFMPTAPSAAAPLHHSSNDNNEAQLPRHPALFPQQHPAATHKAVASPAASPKLSSKASPALKASPRVATGASPKVSSVPTIRGTGASPAGATRREGSQRKRHRDEDNDEDLIPDIVLE